MMYWIVPLLKSELPQHTMGGARENNPPSTTDLASPRDTKQTTACI